MNGLNPAYVESIIRKAKEGKITTGQAEIDTGPEPSVEEMRFKSKERLEKLASGMLSCFENREPIKRLCQLCSNRGWGGLPGCQNGNATPPRNSGNRRGSLFGISRRPWPLRG